MDTNSRPSKTFSSLSSSLKSVQIFLLQFWGWKMQLSRKQLSFKWSQKRLEPHCGSLSFSSVAQSCPTVCDPLSRSTPGLYFYFWLHWVFVATCRLSLLWSVGFSLVVGPGFSPRRLLMLQSSGPVLAAHRLSCLAAHRLSCLAAHGIFQDQGSSLGLLHWQVDS